MSYSRVTAVAGCLMLAVLAGCSTIDKVDSWVGLASSKDDSQVPAGKTGYVVGDEPLAVQAGAAVLQQGGSAADAVTAMYFALSATYPVAAGLGGGGLCVLHDSTRERSEAVVFLSRDSANGGAFGVPGNVRGFSILQQNYGRLPWQRDVAPGEGLAATGFPISQALETRLRAAQNAIRLDANLAAEFLDESGAVKPVGTQVSNPDLGATLTAIRIFGPNALYSGATANKLVVYSGTQGGAFTLNELAGYPVGREVPASANIGDYTVYFPPKKVGAGAFVQAMLSRTTGGGSANPAADIASATKAALEQFSIQSLPRDLGATGFAAADGMGQAVGCAVTLNGAFGSGHTATGTGIVLSRAPSSKDAGLSGAFLSPMVVTSSDGSTLAMAGAGAGGPNGTAAMIYALLRVVANDNILEPGRLHSTGIAPFDTVNVVACQSGTCAALPDPAANGLGAAATTTP